MFDWEKPTAILIGRYQPPHAGHLALVKAAIEKVGQVAILIRFMPRDDKNPFGYNAIYEKWLDLLEPDDLIDKVTILQVPNVSHVFYGRDVGYKIEYLDMPPEIQAISATKIRESM